MCAPGEAQGKRFHIESVDIETQIHTDGSLTISEVRTYQFKGSYSWADYSLPLGNLGPVTGFSVSEETRVYEASSSEDPGTYYTQVEDDKFYARWFFQSRNEIRSFTLRYRLENVVLVYRDTAEFYYQFAGSANQQEIGSVNVSIKLPQPAEFPKVRVWAHGPLHGTVAIENGHIFLAVTPMPRHEFWESRVTFPTHWVPDVASGWAQRLDQIVQKEEEYAREANQRRATQEKREKLAEPIALGLSLLGVIVIGFLLSRYGRGFQVPYQLKIDSEIPSDLHPTLVSYIYHGKQVYSSALAASLFNLACQGILSIEQAGEKPKWWQGGGSRFVFRLSRKNWFSQRDELHDFDNDLIDFFFNKLAKGTDVLSSKELREGGSQMRKWFQNGKSWFTAMSPNPCMIHPVYGPPSLRRPSRPSLWYRESSPPFCMVRQVSSRWLSTSFAWVRPSFSFVIHPKLN